MHLEHDYTNYCNGKDLGADEIGKEKTADSFCSTADLEFFLEYCRIRDTQFAICPSELKRERLFQCYEQLKKLAFAHNGKITLDIDENMLKAKLTYWSQYIVLYFDKSSDSKNILSDLLKDFDIIYIEEDAGGIQICAEENLFDEIQIKDEKLALLKLRESRRKKQNN